MKFPANERVEYGKNPLFEVVCQAHFPEILKIGDEDPSGFQDILRKKGYPEWRVESPELPADIPAEIIKAVARRKTFRFGSEDGNWSVLLARNFVALACQRDYQDFAGFSARLENVLDTFWTIYEPAYLLRLGLRYRNLVAPTSVPGITDEDIAAFIPRHIAPELSQDVASEVQQFEKSTLYGDESCKVHVTHVLARLTGAFGKYQINSERAYIIDIDCFTEHKVREVRDALARCREFNGIIRNVFRWSITDPLHQAMEPKPA